MAPNTLREPIFITPGWMGSWWSHEMRKVICLSCHHRSSPSERSSIVFGWYLTLAASIACGCGASFPFKFLYTRDPYSQLLWTVRRIDHLSVRPSTMPWRCTECRHSLSQGNFIHHPNLDYYRGDEHITLNWQTRDARPIQFHRVCQLYLQRPHVTGHTLFFVIHLIGASGNGKTQAFAGELLNWGRINQKLTQHSRHHHVLRGELTTIKASCA